MIIIFKLLSTIFWTCGKIDSDVKLRPYTLTHAPEDTDTRELTFFNIVMKMKQIFDWTSIIEDHLIQAKTIWNYWFELLFFLLINNHEQISHSCTCWPTALTQVKFDKSQDQMDLLFPDIASFSNYFWANKNEKRNSIQTH